MLGYALLSSLKLIKTENSFESCLNCIVFFQKKKKMVFEWFQEIMGPSEVLKESAGTELYCLDLIRVTYI
jgi:hypothetical protein